MDSRITKTVALAALMAGTSGVASATEGWYGRADVGYSIDGYQEIANVQRNFEEDWTQHLGLGYAFENGFRFEGELSHRFNQMEPGGGLTTGDVHAWAGMLNLYYDFNRGGTFEPYIGGGVGSARINAGAVGGFGTFDDDDSVFAYQGLAGVAIGLTERLDLDIGYRYFVAADAGFRGFNGNVPATYDGDYVHQAVTVGLRMQFGAAEPPPPPPVPPTPPVPPPVPPPPPAACPTSDFVVYFEWDRSNLNQAALETIDAAVNRARQCNVSGVVVVGHTDTSGSTQYNQGLSERRASVVRDALVARGIAAGAITSSARGETELARATRDGVREPLNRRTAVTIRFR